MKRTLLLVFLFFVFLMFLPFMVSAQEGKTNTVTIKITEDGKVTTDTTFQLSEGQDPDAVKKIVEELAGGDIHVKMEKNAHKKVMYVAEDEDSWDIHDIDIDSIKEAHGGAHVMVMKTDDGNVNVKVLDEEDEDYEFESEKGKTYKVKVIKEGKGDCEGKKQIKVFIDEDDNVQIIEESGDLKWVEEDEDGGQVIIIESDDGGDKVIMKKQIKVEIQEDKGEVVQEKEVVVKKKKAKEEKR